MFTTQGTNKQFHDLKIHDRSHFIPREPRILNEVHDHNKKISSKVYCYISSYCCKGSLQAKRKDPLKILFITEVDFESQFLCLQKKWGMFDLWFN